MRTITQARHNYAEKAEGRSFVLDTTFVLFFLALDCGQRFAFGFEGFLSAVTLIMFVVFPYFLPYNGEKPGFERWVIGRAAIASFAIVLGLIFRQSLGVFLPEAMRFIPFSLLIVTAVVSCYVQLYSIMRFRLAK
ncbi:MAG: hypothetical protein HOP17_08130 [Acidobacteria bacterium]|nr:hypothetical protein [Acidobacteriota bacterium]